MLSNLFREDLRNVSLVNQYLRTLAEPHLLIPTSSHHLTARSILRRPELATYIQKLELIGRSFSEHRF